MSDPQPWVGWYAQAPFRDSKPPARDLWFPCAWAASYRECLAPLQRRAPFGALQAVMRRGTHPADPPDRAPVTATTKPESAPWAGNGRTPGDGTTQREILRLLGEAPASVQALADALGRTTHAVRTSLILLRRAGLIVLAEKIRRVGQSGRPIHVWALARKE